MITIAADIDINALETLLRAIPETAGLLAFGMALALSAIFLRSVLRASDPQSKENTGNK